MESHQASKLDVSGTAKAVISCFEKLGVSFDLDEVRLLLCLFNSDKTLSYHQQFFFELFLLPD